jgi:hypothetical protein
MEKREDRDAEIEYQALLRRGQSVGDPARNENIADSFLSHCDMSQAICQKSQQSQDREGRWHQSKGILISTKTELKREAAFYGTEGD